MRTVSKDLIIGILEEFKGMTERHPLSVGFNHSGVTYKELKDRVEDIRKYAEELIEYIESTY